MKIKSIINKIFAFDTNDTEKIKKSQQRVIILFAIIIACILVMVVLSSDKKSKTVSIDKRKSNNKIEFAKSISVSAEEDWRNVSENEMLAAKTKQQELEDKIAELEEEIKNKNNNDDAVQMINDIAYRLGSLESRVDGSAAGTGEQATQYSKEDIEQNNKMVSADFTLENSSEEESDGISFEDYIPAGAYATASLISGAEPSVAVSSQGNPRNIQLRLTGETIGAEFNGKKQTTQKLKGCLITGAATGDISSERVYIRLLKMVCSFSKGKSIEYDVKGIVYSSGVEGIRGKVISREGNLLMKSFLAGTVEGLGSAGATALSPTLSTTNGVTSYSYTAKDVGLQGLASGVSKSADKMSDYLIERAEQYQPVVSVQGGIEVEVAFQSGIDLTAGKRSLKKVNNLSQATANSLSNDMNTNGTYGNQNMNNANIKNVNLQDLRNYNTNIDVGGMNSSTYDNSSTYNNNKKGDF
jgi:conjugal transfer pilus assembly protein TraB